MAPPTPPSHPLHAITSADARLRPLSRARLHLQPPWDPDPKSVGAFATDACKPLAAEGRRLHRQAELRRLPTNPPPTAASSPMSASLDSTHADLPHPDPSADVVDAEPDLHRPITSMHVSRRRRRQSPPDALPALGRLPPSPPPTSILADLPLLPPTPSSVGAFHRLPPATPTCQPPEVTKPSPKPSTLPSPKADGNHLNHARLRTSPPLMSRQPCCPGPVGSDPTREDPIPDPTRLQPPDPTTAAAYKARPLAIEENFAGGGEELHPRGRVHATESRGGEEPPPLGQKLGFLGFGLVSSEQLEFFMSWLYVG